MNSLKTTGTLICFLTIVLLHYTVSYSKASESYKEPEFPVIKLCREAKFHEAFRLLPKAMDAWELYKNKTGSNSEGAAEYLYHFTMEEVAVKGDLSWGKIFDDLSIPYKYKTDLIFAILERRIGKGSVFSINHNYYIIPRLKKSESRQQLIKTLFLQKKKREQIK